LGYPPLVTPSSQIVGTQATLNVILGERYKVIPQEVKNYVKGMYGRPPAPVAPKIKKMVLEGEEPIDCRPADLIPPGLEQARAEIGGLARSEEDVLSYALFPQVARPFLERRARGGSTKEEIVAAIAALIAIQAEKEPEPVMPHTMISPWKLAGRQAQTKWGGLLP
jgi:pyruvate/oxaloacetate carboxyltransferase